MEVAALLLAKGANIHAQNKVGVQIILFEFVGFSFVAWESKNVSKWDVRFRNSNKCFFAFIVPFILFLFYQKQRTPLHIAAERNFKGSAQLFLDKGADIDAKTKVVDVQADALTVVSNKNLLVNATN